MRLGTQLSDEQRERQQARNQAETTAGQNHDLRQSKEYPPTGIRGQPRGALMHTWRDGGNMQREALAGIPIWSVALQVLAVLLLTAVWERPLGWALQGAVHLVLFTVFLFLAIVP
jgi:hypothetical protein